MSDEWNGWICKTPGCGHNKSAHRYEWNPFRGEWNTSCRSQEWGRSGRDTCRCSAFAEDKEDELNEDIVQALVDGDLPTAARLYAEEKKERTP